MPIKSSASFAVSACYRYLHSASACSSASLSFSFLKVQWRLVDLSAETSGDIGCRDVATTDRRIPTLLLRSTTQRSRLHIKLEFVRALYIYIYIHSENILQHFAPLINRITFSVGHGPHTVIRTFPDAYESFQCSNLAAGHCALDFMKVSVVAEKAAKRWSARRSTSKRIVRVQEKEEK